MIRFLISISILFHSSLAFAQQPTQTIRGKVIDQASQMNIPFATVVILDSEPLLGATTDIDGNFKLEKVLTGRYNLKISFVGYETAIIKELVVSSAKETVINVSLKENVTTMDEVVVIAKMSKEAPLNIASTVSARMLSVDEASRYAGGFDDPARLVSSFAGVASNVADNSIVIRGNAPKALQWKMEGIEIPNPNHFADLSAFGGGGITALSSQMLANSDFFTGAFPAEYSNALSGVFDIYMRNGNNQKAEHTFQIGAIGIDASSEGAFRKRGESSYLFNYRYATLSLLEPLLPKEAQGTGYQDLSFKLNFPTKKGGAFSVWGIGLIDRSGQIAETDKTQWKYIQNKEEVKIKQYMGAVGLNYKVFLNKTTQLKTALAVTSSGLNLKTQRMNKEVNLLPQNRIRNINWNYVFTSSVNKKFSKKHTNKTGIKTTVMNYSLLLEEAEKNENPLQTLVEEDGLSVLSTIYSNSTVYLSNKLTMNIGLVGQVFSLNGNYTIEPRIGLKWYLKETQSLGIAYGLHSRLEKLNYYFTKSNTDNTLINKDVDFTKSHHFVLSYDVKLSENVLLKVEPYYQQLFNIPVIADSSFSFINLKNEWFFNDKLENTGKGRNFGVDVTLEKYLSKGYYYMFTASVFKSEYTGGDGVWRNTLYNRDYLFNFLFGKEWELGSNKQKVLGINTRFSYQGGDRYSPINKTASLLKKEVVYDETKSYSLQSDPTFLAHFTISYKINKVKSTHLLALKVLNATGQTDFLGNRYNFTNNKVEAYREAIMIPNISYKIEF